MKIERTPRGFNMLTHDGYPPSQAHNTRLVQESSGVDFGACERWQQAGASYLWIGEHHHLDRHQVGELIAHLQRWLASGSLRD